MEKSDAGGAAAGSPFFDIRPVGFLLKNKFLVWRGELCYIIRYDIRVVRLCMKCGAIRISSGS